MMSAAIQETLESPLVGRRTIPFDYSFRFSLTGVPNTTLTEAITISVESAFVAVSIGYGVIPQTSSVSFGVPPVPPPPIFVVAPAQPPDSLVETTFAHLITSIAPQVGEEAALRKGSIGSATAAVLTGGFRLNQRLAERALLGGGTAALEPQELATMFESIGGIAGQVQFLYALRDEGTGREFQSRPILNTAGLGIANGDRPFRYFATPISFAPRATIRMDITEVSNFKGDLHVSLHGYRELGGTGSPTALAAVLRQKPRRTRRR